MPTKHVVKFYAAPAFYHVYNRASGERKLFRDTQDRQFFMMLLQKHLAETEPSTEEDALIKRYEIEIVAYCLMGTHFHLLLFQQDDPDAITGYMRSVSTSYSMYYNKKYKSKGHVFQSNFRASHITNEPYLVHITRYIHLNPRMYDKWLWSSYREYVGTRHSNWVHKERVLENNYSTRQYQQFITDGLKSDRRQLRAGISSQLAE